MLSTWKLFQTPLLRQFNATISAPHVHSFLFSHMFKKLVPGAKCLDIGTGSGYLAACMSARTGMVDGIEHVPELRDHARDTMCSLGLKSNIELADALRSSGDRDIDGGYDVINVGGTVLSVDTFLTDQLNDDGIMLATIGEGYSDQTTYLFKKTDGAILSKKITDDFVFAPLTALDYQLSEQYLNDPFNPSFRKMELREQQIQPGR